MTTHFERRQMNELNPPEKVDRRRKQFRVERKEKPNKFLEALSLVTKTIESLSRADQKKISKAVSSIYGES